MGPSLFTVGILGLIGPVMGAVILDLRGPARAIEGGIRVGDASPRDLNLEYRVDGTSDISWRLSFKFDNGTSMISELSV